MTAKTITRAAAGLLAALVLPGCDSPSAGKEPGPPAHLDVVSGDLQTGPVGVELPQPLVVRLTDAAGRPLGGQAVTFIVTAGSGTLFAGTATTDAKGEAAERWTLGPVYGDTQRVEARVVNAAGQAIVATFRAMGTPVVAHLWPWNGFPALTRDGFTSTDTLVVRAENAAGNALPGVTVTWTVQANGGSITPLQSATDAGGLARAVWTATARRDTVKTALASAGGATAAFTLKGDLPARVALSWRTTAQTRKSNPARNEDPGGFRVVVGSPVQIVGKVTTADGSSLRGVLVTFLPRPGSGSATPAVSNRNGEALGTWTMGTQVAPSYRMFSDASSPGTTADSIWVDIAPDSMVAVGVSPSSSLSLAVGDSVEIVPRGVDVHGNMCEIPFEIINNPSTFAVADSTVVAVHPLAPINTKPVSTARVVARASGTASIDVGRTAECWLGTKTLHTTVQVVVGLP